MSKIILILPNQLFEKNQLLQENYDCNMFLLEHPLFFSRHRFHKIKLIMHRASMKMYFDYIQTEFGIKNCIYVSHAEYKQFFSRLTEKKRHVVLYDPVDCDIYSEFEELKPEYWENPLFLTSSSELNEFCQLNKGNYFFSNFYTWIRRKKQILVSKDGKNPLGYAWIIERGSKLPANEKNGQNQFDVINNNKYIKEAKIYVSKVFEGSVGSEEFLLPITFEECKLFLDLFIQKGLKGLSSSTKIVNEVNSIELYDLVAALVNIGLLRSDYVIQKSVEFFELNNKRISLADIEGLVRCLLGEREFLRLLYVKAKESLLRPSQFENSRKISENWLRGTTQIAPIDSIIMKFLKFGCSSSLERFVYALSFMHMNKISIPQILAWNLMFIDAYSWNTFPLIFPNFKGTNNFDINKAQGLVSSQFISQTSRFTIKYDFYPKIKDKYEWFEIWDSLYYHFIYENANLLRKNYGTSCLVDEWSKLNETKRLNYKVTALWYLNIFGV